MEEEEKKNERERCKSSKTLCAVKKKDSLPSLTILIVKNISSKLFLAIIIKGHKVDLLCLKKCVCFYWECLLISCVLQLIFCF